MEMHYDDYGLIPDKKQCDDLEDLLAVHLDEKDEFVLKQFDKKEDVFNFLMLQSQKIANDNGIHESTALLLLENNKWTPEIVQDLLLKDRETALLSIGIDPRHSNDDPTLKNPEKGGECGICCMEYEPEDLFHLPCGHTYCVNCWKEHIEFHISKGQTRIMCMEGHCKCRLSISDVQKLSNKKDFENYIRFTIDRQISLNDAFTNCPNPECSKPLYLLGSNNKNRLCNVIKCTHCNYEFCLKCGEESHAPATCLDVEQWRVVTDDNIMDQRLFGENIKRCPNCHVIIEKNYGSNHMTCRNCRHEFCWKCMASWNAHPKTYFVCAAYRPENDPFLRKPDQISPEFINPYYDEFIRYKIKIAEFDENKDAYTKSLINYFVKSHGVKAAEINDICKNLIDQLHWAYINLQWTCVYLFTRRNKQFQEIGITGDAQVMNPIQPENKYLLVQMAKNELVLAVEQVENLYSLLYKGKNVNLKLAVFGAIVKKIMIYREQLLKQCDKNY